jgi:hypothetical protein
MFKICLKYDCNNAYNFLRVCLFYTVSAVTQVAESIVREVTREGQCSYAEHMLRQESFHLPELGSATHYVAHTWAGGFQELVEALEHWQVNPPPLTVNWPPLTVNPPPLTVNPPPLTVNPPPLTVNSPPLTANPPPPDYESTPTDRKSTPTDCKSIPTD